MTGSRTHLAVVVVALCVVATALGVAYTKHRSREMFVQLQTLKAQRDALNVEWGKLMLEQSTWATPPRVEQVAREHLDMRVPSSDEIVIVTSP